MNRTVLHFDHGTLAKVLQLPESMEILYAYPEEYGAKLAIVVKEPGESDGSYLHGEKSPEYVLDDATGFWTFVGFKGDENEPV